MFESVKVRAFFGDEASNCDLKTTMTFLKLLSSIVLYIKHVFGRVLEMRTRYIESVRQYWAMKYTQFHDTPTSISVQPKIQRTIIYILCGSKSAKERTY